MRERPSQRVLMLVVLPLLMAGWLAVNAAQGVQRSRGIARVEVRGRWLLANGRPWVPRGVQIVGLVAPDLVLRGAYARAHEHFGRGELRTALSFHADLVRFQVSQFGLDPADPLHSPAYAREVRRAVNHARQLGLAVIVSLQAESPAGEGDRCPLPDAGAQRAWERLAVMFGHDPGVLFELYNEPGLRPSPSAWAEWASGGMIYQGNYSCRTVGMQRLIRAIRARAAHNVLIVPGLAFQHTLAGHPPLKDPASPHDPQLVYGVHYPWPTRSTGDWDRAFGNASSYVPVIVSEWDANSTTYCVSNTPAYARRLLRYLARKRIGIVGFALDLPGTLIADWSYRPTTYRNFKCGVGGDGPGRMLFGGFAAQARSGAP